MPFVPRPLYAISAEVFFALAEFGGCSIQIARKGTEAGQLSHKKAHIPTVTI
jgi:hypothetical protein